MTRLPEPRAERGRRSGRHPRAGTLFFRAHFYYKIFLYKKKEDRGAMPEVLFFSVIETADQPLTLWTETIGLLRTASETMMPVLELDAWTILPSPA